MGREAAARWRRRGWRAFVDGLPTVLPRRTVLVLAAVTGVLVVGVAAVAVAFLGEDGVVRAGVAGALSGAGAGALAAAATSMGRARRAQRGLRRVRVLDEGLLAGCLAEDDTVTADAATTDTLDRLVHLTRAATPPLLLGQLLLGTGAVLVVLAAVLVGAPWTSVMALPITALGALAGAWTLSDSLGRTETVAAAIADGTVVEPVRAARRPTATWHD